MADIRITQTHELPHDAARNAAQQIAHQMAKEYDMSANWDGDVLLFSRSGVSGRLALLEKEAQLEIQLGFLFKAFASTIEEKVAAKMRKVFAAAA
ncbi:polyhydroxyalkanoic acid system protein [Noviherbaspirillum cavernae]|uniref:Polyhydroxyalkanoic acid system protein n=1 Tax=Noviherbaspirillum cavernae TaxID=2320862 RepID=A0A418WYZ7_9BURK|nr:polyhydroxyalkanoic acid system family protein [Noviherbaspirillum cavernae]RJG05460.1 polyhydroxyalkanoic acid system protein [Noviherbaspirillum cavernae]